jgi:exopolysaccharide biosynthesis polyprenyl glycosylphosphotransferase
MSELKEIKVFDLALEKDVKKSYLITKRTLDITLSLIGLVVLIPVFIIIMILIKLEDRSGPILFKQSRVGINGKTFNMYKFRSMVNNAESLLENIRASNESTGPLFKMKDDPRVTKIGKFIRKTSIDELPQLINVIKGDMSLVGPRPALPSEVAEYSNYHKKRLIVKPGLTCYWQVGGRSNIGFEGQVDLDIKYIKERTTLIDLRIIIKTFSVFFGSQGAY